MNNKAADTALASILLVEDEPGLREDICEELQAAGYRVVSCSDGRQALAVLTSERPDLILCDISMPVMDGYTLLETLHAQRPDLADIPFIFLTAQASPAQVAQGKRAGADDYLVKPVDFDLMLATIEARLRQLSRLKKLRHDAPPGQQLDSLQGVLDSLAISLVMFTADSRICFVNKMACANFDLRVGASLPEFVQAIGIREAEALHKAIQKMIDNTGTATHCMALTMADTSAQNILATICALARTESAGPAPSHPARHAAPAVSVIVSSMPSQRLQPPVELLQTLYDLTPAEARVAWAFAQGRRSDEISAQFQISPTTVAFHKRNIFLKTQTNRQADLITLLLSLPFV